ncbi:hypothetical protein J4H86_23610 [Spiractinospora alimapuensis]|uniref:hypothetical protein n=1 Tax=Spiractinospora alimapuensis TaxID=2820884 RepID=UPI001F2F5863|nr:hypothetical protein [Spiractinospora alimapuensis]QVQ51723.1 hypothetical protein J4H86_23610 [Spiractinospora alimapuensis]
MFPAWSLPAAIGLMALTASLMVLLGRRRAAVETQAKQVAIDGPTLARPVASIPRDRPVRVWPALRPLATTLLWPAGGVFMLLYASVQPDAAPVGRDWTLGYHTVASLLVAASVVLIVQWVRAAPLLAADSSGIWVRTARAYPGVVFSGRGIWVTWEGVESLVLTAPSARGKNSSRCFLGIGLTDAARADLDRGQRERHVHSRRALRIEERNVHAPLDDVVRSLAAWDPRPHTERDNTGK